MGQITQSLDILCTYDSNLAPDRYISTVAGFYALLPYAFEFWMDHLLDCLDDTPPDEIMEQLQQLCEKLRQLSLPSALSNNVLETAQDLDPRLTKLISEEEALLISRSWLIMKENSTLGVFHNSITFQ
jgi:hypothetical protein